MQQDASSHADVQRVDLGRRRCCGRDPQKVRALALHESPQPCQRGTTQPWCNRAQRCATEHNMVQPSKTWCNTAHAHCREFAAVQVGAMSPVPVQMWAGTHRSTRRRGLERLAGFAGERTVCSPPIAPPVKRRMQQHDAMQHATCYATCNIRVLSANEEGQRCRRPLTYARARACQFPPLHEAIWRTLLDAPRISKPEAPSSCKRRGI